MHYGVIGTYEDDSISNSWAFVLTYVPFLFTPYRFLGYHASIVYYWALNFLFLLSPRAAYEFMELLESHAGTVRITIFGLVFTW